MDQVAALVGALLILSAYAGIQLGLVSREDRLYNAANLVGAAVLAVIAFEARLWAFVLLEGVWAALSVPPLLRRWR